MDHQGICLNGPPIMGNKYKWTDMRIAEKNATDHLLLLLSRNESWVKTRKLNSWIHLSSKI